MFSRKKQPGDHIVDPEQGMSGSLDAQTMLDAVTACAPTRTFLHKSERIIHPLSNGDFANKSKEMPGGKIVEALSTLIRIGGSTVIGIDFMFNGKRGKYGALEYVRLAVLPLSTDPLSISAKNHSSTTIYEAHIPTQKDFVRIPVGRELVSDLDGVEDLTISGNHMTIQIDEDGTVMVADHSTNGSELVTSLDLSQSIGSFTEDQRDASARLLEGLSQNTEAWRRDSAGVRVIRPDGSTYI